MVSFMLNHNEVKLVAPLPSKNMPLDAKIVGWFIFYTAFISLLIGVLLVSGIGRFTSSESSRNILFGTITISSELSHGIYIICISFLHFVCGYGVAKGYKFSWWLMLIPSLSVICDWIMMLPDHQTGALICICINLGIIAWLIYRRKFYGIRAKPIIISD
ncbi:MAG: hypothetical protein FVQ85_20185 [Planctomycetes bacterium]|nr:hypothetical protein [Planctomycetota bacterium]